MNFQFSRHALQEMQNRGIPLSIVEAVLNNPQQVVPEQGGKKAYQSQVDLGGKIFLVRVIAAEEVDPPLVVTVYRTSKIAKYWRQP